MRNKGIHFSIILMPLLLPVLAFLSMGLWLENPASDNPVRSDLLVMLGGGIKYREIISAKLFHDGLAQQILLTGDMTNRADGTAIKSTQSYEYLIASGIPAEKILLDKSSKSTWDDVIVIRDQLVQTRNQSVIIVTDPPHIRRVYWVCQQILKPEGIHYQLVASEPDWWNATYWWENPYAREFASMEYIKLLYYLVHYFNYIPPQR